VSFRPEGVAAGDASLVQIATKLVMPEVTVGWVLGLYPDAGEAGGTFQYRARSRGCAQPGPALDPDRSGSEAARRARAKVRRYAAANRLDRLGTLTYKGDGLHDERALRRHVGHFFKRLRYEVVGEPYPYVWVPEWHKTDHGLHVHFAVDRFIDHDAMTVAWGRGFTHIKRLGNVKQEGSLSSARHAAGYLSKYVSKAFAQHERSPGLHRYEVAQGFRPRVERIVAATREGAIEAASERMGRAPATTWSSDEAKEWQGPPTVWAAWDD
jgi:hypothetical protein